MNEEKLRQQICVGIERKCAALRLDPYRVQKVIRSAESKGGAVVKKKLSIGLILVLAAVLLSVTALAAGIIMNRMTKNVAQMEAAGQRIRWNFDDKFAFVGAMRDAGYEMSEADWDILSGDAKSMEEREAAADRIIYERFGAVQEEANAQSVQPLHTVLGAMPDVVEIFRERFLAENPDATEQEYADALGYWLRDEYKPAYQEAAQAEKQTETTAASFSVQLTREMAEDYLNGYLTEVLGWTNSAAIYADKTCEQDAVSGAWHISAQGAEGETSFWLTSSQNGDICRENTLETLLVKVADINRQIILRAITEEQAVSVAKAAVAGKYGISEAELAKYFVSQGEQYTNEPDCIRVGVLFNIHDRVGSPWKYAAIVNLTTGNTDDIFTDEELFDRLPVLAGAWEHLQENDAWLPYYRFYTTWSPCGSFGQWPLAAQAKASEAFGRFTSFEALESFNKHVYTLPNENELTEEHACTLAITAAAKQVGLSENEVVSYQIQRTFSRDEQEPPMWRFMFTDEKGTSSVWRIVVWLNGYTGEVIYAGTTAPDGATWFTDADVL